MQYRKDKPSGEYWDEFKEIVAYIQNAIDTIEAGKDGDDFAHRFDQLLWGTEDLHAIVDDVLYD